MCTFTINDISRKDVYDARSDTACSIHTAENPLMFLKCDSPSTGMDDLKQRNLNLSRKITFAAERSEVTSGCFSTQDTTRPFNLIIRSVDLVSSFISFILSCIRHGWFVSRDFTSLLALFQLHWRSDKNTIFLFTLVIKLQYSCGRVREATLNFLFWFCFFVCFFLSNYLSFSFIIHIFSMMEWFFSFF